MDELKERIITLEQKFESHEKEDFRQHANFVHRLDRKADKDDVQELKKDIQNDFSERDRRIKENRLDIEDVQKEQSKTRLVFGFIISTFGGVGILITWVIDRWEKIKNYLP